MPPSGDDLSADVIERRLAGTLFGRRPIGDWHRLNVLPQPTKSVVVSMAHGGDEQIPLGGDDGGGDNADAGVEGIDIGRRRGHHGRAVSRRKVVVRHPSMNRNRDGCAGPDHSDPGLH
jgi:hypothetical protein